MARQILTQTVAPGPDPTAGVAVTMTAEDTSNHSRFLWRGQELVLIQNTGGSTYTYTVTSKADERGRTGNITTQSILAGEIHVLDCLSYPGWVQSDEYVYLDASNVAVKFGVIRTKGRAV